MPSRDDILAALDDSDSDCLVLGLRVVASDDPDWPVPEVGDALPCSRVWDDGLPTDEDLDGTSTVFLTHDGAPTADEFARAMQLIRSYQGSHLLLVGGSAYHHGQDHQNDEAVISDAVCLGVWALDAAGVR